MGSVNSPNSRVDQTVRIFDNFYRFDVNVPAAEFDVVNSYFQSVFTSPEAALNFTTSLFRVAQQTNTPVLTLLQQLQTQSQEQIQINALLAYYLNGIRSRSTLLGINSSLTPNLFTARNVLS